MLALRRRHAGHAINKWRRAAGARLSRAVSRRSPLGFIMTAQIALASCYVAQADAHAAHHERFG